MRIGKRPFFFLGIAGAFLVLLIPTPAEFRWLDLAMAGLALVWFVLLALEELSARKPPTDSADRGRP
jgi:hypothetical protein